jgi:hypothetical protein
VRTKSAICSMIVLPCFDACRRLADCYESALALLSKAGEQYVKDLGELEGPERSAAQKKLEDVLVQQRAVMDQYTETANKVLQGGFLNCTWLSLSVISELQIKYKT